MNQSESLKGKPNGCSLSLDALQIAKAFYENLRIWKGPMLYTLGEFQLKFTALLKAYDGKYTENSKK